MGFQLPTSTGERRISSINSMVDKLRIAFAYQP